MKRLVGFIAAVLIAWALVYVISPWNYCDLVPDSLKETFGCPPVSGGGGSGAGQL